MGQGSMRICVKRKVGDNYRTRPLEGTEVFHETKWYLYVTPQEVTFEVPSQGSFVIDVSETKHLMVLNKTNEESYVVCKLSPAEVKKLSKRLKSLNGRKSFVNRRIAYFDNLSNVNDRH